MLLYCCVRTNSHSVWYSTKSATQAKSPFRPSARTLLCARAGPTQSGHLLAGKPWPARTKLLRADSEQYGVFWWPVRTMRGATYPNVIGCGGWLHLHGMGRSLICASLVLDTILHTRVHRLQILYKSLIYKSLFAVRCARFIPYFANNDILSMLAGVRGIF